MSEKHSPAPTARLFGYFSRKDAKTQRTPREKKSNLRLGANERALFIH